MKKVLFLTVSCILFSTRIFSQNWAPLNPNEQFNFQNDTSNVISSVIFADSVEFNGLDSVYYLNRIVTVCDTCTGSNPVYLLSNQPQFLQRIALKKPGGIWNFSSLGNLALHTEAPQGFSWTLDSISGMTATLDSITVETVFGSLDSVKHVILQNGDSISFSKSFGILKWPDGFGSGIYHRLVGVKGRDLGELLPGFSGIFNLQPGTQIQIYWSETVYDPTGIFSSSSTFKFSVDSSRASGDSTEFFVHGVRNGNYGWGSFPAVGLFNGSFTVVDSTAHFCNHYPGQLLKYGNRFHNYLVDPYIFIPISNEVFGQDTIYQRVNYFRDANGLVSMGTTNFSGVWAGYYSFSDPASPVMSVSFQEQDSLLYREGLGLTDYEWYNFESGGYWHMAGYAMNGDTVGTLTPDSVLLSSVIGCPGGGVNIFLWPNPASNQMYLEGNWNGQTTITLLSIEGKIFRTLSAYENSIEMNVADLPSGIYLLEIQTQTGSARKKLVITR